MADPAFASLRGVQLPKELQMLEDESDEEEDAIAAGAGKRSAGGRPDARAVTGRGDVLPDSFEDDEDEEDEEGAEAEDIAARPDDVFLLAANTEDDYSSLEVYCYNTREGSLYVHHDLTLPALPLCLAWMDYAGDAAASAMSAQCGLGGAGGADAFVGSYVAVGTFKPDIEIWNLDVLDPLEPALILKGAKKSASSSGKKGGKGAKKAEAGSDAAGHSDAVMGISWNRTHRHMLASSSADTTVKIWDMDGRGKVLHTYRHHIGKVQAVAWNPVEPTILASAAFDRTVAVVDAREGPAGRVARYALPADSEALQWHPHNPVCLVAACEDGSIVQYDCRAPDKPLWKFKAHGTNAVTSFSFSPLARGLFATGSLDKTVKLWDANTPTSAGAPTCVSSKEMNIGQVFSVSFFPQSAYLLGAGGSKGMVAIWDVAADAGEVTPAGMKLPAAAAPATAAPASTEAAAVAAEAGAGAGAGAGSAPAPKTIIARRFDPHVQDIASVPMCAVRPREDGQLAGLMGSLSSAGAAGAAAGAGAGKTSATA
jgi:periodic tryptophan protein 1